MGTEEYGFPRIKDKDKDKAELKAMAKVKRAGYGAYGSSGVKSRRSSRPKGLRIRERN
jgi:hypothetical protein